MAGAATHGPDTWRVFYIPSGSIPQIQYCNDIAMVMEQTAKADYDVLFQAFRWLATAVRVSYPSFDNSVTKAWEPMLTTRKEWARSIPSEFKALLDSALMNHPALCDPVLPAKFERDDR